MPGIQLKPRWCLSVLPQCPLKWMREKESHLFLPLLNWGTKSFLMFIHFFPPSVLAPALSAVNIARSCNHTARALFIGIDLLIFSFWGPHWSQTGFQKTGSAKSWGVPSTSSGVNKPALQAGWSCRECSRELLGRGDKTPSGAEVLETKQDSHEGMKGHC